jgi:4-aminobutyrate aminotransferase-like enzyme/Ser/Thr protein kinase RdoA (MazF antagonist)
MTAFWAGVLKKVWQVDATLTQLDGEYDLNFLVNGEQSAVLKVMRANCETSFIDLQCRAFAHLTNYAPEVPAPSIINTISGELYTSVMGPDNEERIVWLLEKIEGSTYAKFKPQSLALIEDVGQVVGAVDKAWENFEHPALERDFKWNLCQGDWITQESSVIKDPPKSAVIDDIIQQFAQIKPQLLRLKPQAIHNDVNDYNLIVDGSLTQRAHVTGLIDLGDMCASPRICDLAITAAYMVLDQRNPEQVLEAIVKGYHRQYPLTSEELELLWPLLRMRLAVSVINSTLMAIENPNDPYIVISQAPAWQFLLGNNINTAFLALRLKVACGLEITESATRIRAWLEAQRGSFAPVLGADLSDAPLRSLSVENCTIPQNPFDINAKEAANIGGDYDSDEGIWLGFYNEPRLAYTDPVFSNGPYKASSRRTVHLGVDAFTPAGLEVHSPLAGKVEFAQYHSGFLDYGGMVILSHQTHEGDTFYTLYGHLDRGSISLLTVGQLVQRNEVFAAIGSHDSNGGWNPHLHFQLALTNDGIGDNWPGAADPDELVLYNAICPNPAALMNLPDEKTEYMGTQKAQVLAQRKAKFGENLKLTYADPVMFLRGWRHHLFDENGRPFLDSYNNVPHVGHAHPRIQAVAADQLKRMNSNTRYLHPAQIAFADKILSKMPESLEVCFFVNSGTEANELALRLARAHTGGKDMITPDHGYHGNTTGAIDISAYKFNAKDGVGQPDWVQLVEVADEYRGSYQRDDAQRAEKYANLVDAAINNIDARSGRLAGFIAETFPSVGGQIIPPEGYLQGVYQRIRAAGGVCIADEVQTALGRLGEYYFAFEQQRVVPDIVVMGKPIGNGHPIGVLVTTKAIAASFAEGPEYFSTFGGSNLSCRIGKEVLDIVDEEGLMENAKLMGAKLKDGLVKLQTRHPLIGDVRGCGLFIGLDLVEDRESKEPATAAADYVINRLREHRILMGTEGPAHNILKIRPPITIEEDDVNMILQVMGEVLSEAESLMEV